MDHKLFEQWTITIWNLRVQKKNHQFKIVQIKSLATHMTKLILQNIFMEHDLYLIS